MRLLMIITAFSLMLAHPAEAQTKRIVALGDSLTVGYGLPKGEDFVTRLQEALIAEGHDVRIENAGISGDTSAGGKARVATAIAGPQKPDLVLLALGANDMLRRYDPAKTKENLGAIIKILQDQDIPVLLIGIRGMTDGIPFLKTKFDRVYSDLEDEYDVPLYPSFLKGVSMKKDLNQADGIHPNQKGVAIMVENILPRVEKMIE